MAMRIVHLEENVNGIEDNDRFGVYNGGKLVYEYTGQDALSVVIEWRADAQQDCTRILRP